MNSPRNRREVQSLNGKLGALHRFLSKLAEKSLPFFKTLKGCAKKFEWTDDAEQAFQHMKAYIAELPPLTAPRAGEDLLLYLAVGDEAISSVLISEHQGRQEPVYFVSKVLKEAELKYPPLEKAVLTIVHTARRLRRYFQAYPIRVMTNQPLKDILAKPENSGRLAKWAVELGEHGLTYHPRVAIKAYVKQAKQLKAMFPDCSLTQVSRSQNKKADALSKLASLAFAHLTKKVLVEVLHTRSTEETRVQDVQEEGDSWMTPIYSFLTTGALPTDEGAAERLKLTASNYTVEQAELRKCEACQLHAPVKHTPKYDLVTISAAWPFHKWGMDIVGPFPTSKGGVKFLVVAIDYFTKWPEVRPLATITGKQIIKFFWECIICRFGLPGVIITDNGKQFESDPFKSWCMELHIRQVFTSVAHPQSNGQVERMNRSIVDGLKARLGRHGKYWVEELPSVLWAIRTLEKTSHGKTPFSLVYGSEAVIPAEIGVTSTRRHMFHEEGNDAELSLNLDLITEEREQASIKEARYKQSMAKFYNARVRSECFKPNDLVLRKNEASRKEAGGKMGPKWEGPYQIAEAHNRGSYKLRTMEGKPVPRHWNAHNLKRFYV
ncbi:hypothetical protein E3N88_09029 [Mikania micrantha]|uniref:Integrase catalytic domain-containing protein n=1 Tax=Mikania micrantha TaxID=192012 RepID=A0A5N6PK77_9ASTR|nr:hypothetical protein E3N88_09029 [Mikania micrantha]